MLHHREGQAAAAACPFCYLKEVTMAIINLAEWFHLDRRMLNAEEISLLRRLGESLCGHDREIVRRIIATISH